MASLSSLFFFGLWAVVMFLVMQRLHGRAAASRDMTHAPGQVNTDRAKSDLRWVAPATDTDPVCGITVNTDRAKPTVYDGYVYYLCSRECREAFEAAPHLYVGDQSDTTTVENEHAAS